MFGPRKSIATIVTVLLLLGPAFAFAGNGNGNANGNGNGNGNANGNGNGNANGNSNGNSNGNGNGNANGNSNGNSNGNGNGNANGNANGNSNGHVPTPPPPPPPAPPPPAPPPPVTCSLSSSVEIPAQRILGGHVVYFSADALQPFLNAHGQLADAQLWLVLDGKKDKLETLTLALNGIAAQKANGRQHFAFSKDANPGFVARASLGDFRLQGAEPAVHFIQRLFQQRGILAIWTRGPYKVLRAKLIVGASQDPNCVPGGVDNTPPGVTITSATPAATLTNQTSITLTFTSDQSGVSFRCALDGATATLCSSPWSLSGLAAGSHRLEVTAVNTAGLSSASPATYSWTIDNTPPDVTITSAQPAATYTNSPTIAVSFASSKSGTTFMCSLDGGAYTACVSPVGYGGITDGAHVVDVIGTDSLGNVSTSPAHYAWTVDQTPPQVSFVQITGADTVTRDTAPTFYFTASESSTFQCSLDGQPAAPCQSPVAYPAVAEGAHNFVVTAADPAGNVSAPASYSWTIDLTPPVITLGNVVPAAGITKATSGSVEFFVNEPGATISCALDGAPLAACASPVTLSFPSQGQHELSITATDAAGNVSSPVLVDWIVDTSAPIVSFSQILPSAASYISSNTLTVTLVGNEPITYQAQFDGRPLAQNSGSTITLPGLAEGAHSLVVQAYDLAGNPALPLTHNFTVDTIAPTVSISSVQNGSPTSKTSNLFTFASSESVQFQCNVDLAGYVPCSSSLGVSGLAEGAHSISVYGTDLAGNASSPASYSWTIDLTPPKTTIASVTPAGASINVNSVTVQFTVSESATSYCNVDGAAAAACTSPYTASALADGLHTIQIYSIDPAGNKEATAASWSFRVDTAPPTLTLSAIVGALTNSTQAQFTFSSNKQAVFSCTLDGATTPACLSPQAYGNLAEGTHTFTLNARDLAGNAAAPVSFTWTIDVTAPTVTVQGTASALDPTTWGFTLTASEAGSAFQCSLDGAPYQACASGQSYSGLSGGNHSLLVTATDPAGNQGLAVQYNFTVQGVLTTTITSVTPGTSPNNSATITFTFTSSQPGSTFLCTLDGGAPTACGSPKQYTGIASGTHNFLVQAVFNGQVDTAGAHYSWVMDNTLPRLTAISATATSTSMTITWTTSKPTTGQVAWGVSPDKSHVTVANTDFNTQHSVTITGLTPNTVYSYQVSGVDNAGNTYIGTTRGIATNP